MTKQIFVLIHQQKKVILHFYILFPHRTEKLKRKRTKVNMGFWYWRYQIYSRASLEKSAEGCGTSWCGRPLGSFLSFTTFLSFLCSVFCPLPLWSRPGGSLTSLATLLSWESMAFLLSVSTAFYFTMLINALCLIGAPRVLCKYIVMQGVRHVVFLVLTLVGATCLGHGETDVPPFQAKWHVVCYDNSTTILHANE